MSAWVCVYVFFSAVAARLCHHQSHDKNNKKKNSSKKLTISHRLNLLKCIINICCWVYFLNHTPTAAAAASTHTHTHQLLICSIIFSRFFDFLHVQCNFWFTLARAHTHTPCGNYNRAMYAWNWRRHCCHHISLNIELLCRGHNIMIWQKQ